MTPTSSTTFDSKWGDESCTVEFIPDDDIMQVRESIVLNRDFPYYRQFYQASVHFLPTAQVIIDRYIGMGALCRLYGDQIRDVSTEADTSVGLDDIRALNYLILGGCAVGFLAFLIEYYIRHKTVKTKYYCSDSTINMHRWL